MSLNTGNKPNYHMLAGLFWSKRFQSQDSTGALPQCPSDTLVVLPKCLDT